MALYLARSSTQDKNVEDQKPGEQESLHIKCVMRAPIAIRAAVERILILTAQIR